MTMSPEDARSPSSMAARFQTTRWTMVLQAGQGGEEALVKLCRIYWLPLYSFTRRRGHSPHEAEDLTQAFFEHLLQNRGFAGVTPGKGRFRSFLLISLQHFLDNDWHKKQTLKRGGQHVFVSWEELRPEEKDTSGPSDQLTPEKLFNRHWALMVLERVMAQLQRECNAAGKSELFDKLKDCLTGEGGEKSYREIALELGMTEGTVKVNVHRLRRRFGELLRAQIVRTVANPEEVDDEIRELFAALN